MGSSPLTRGKLRPHAEADQAPGLIPAHAGKTSRSPARAGTPRAHPRSRGENCVESPRQMTVKGSSPLTRGKRGDDALCLGDPGLIPAHAGKTVGDLEATDDRQAHPRSRGENLMETDPTQAERGSSPLTRGKLLTVGGFAPAGGLIPAHAGKTWFPDRRDGRRGAHPRSRGENERRVDESADLEGLIPAHAGKTMRTRPIAAV